MRTTLDYRAVHVTARQIAFRASTKGSLLPKTRRFICSSRPNLRLENSAIYNPLAEQFPCLIPDKSVHTFRASVAPGKLPIGNAENRQR